MRLLLLLDQYGATIIARLHRDPNFPNNAVVVIRFGAVTVTKSTSHRTVLYLLRLDTR